MKKIAFITLIAALLCACQSEPKNELRFNENGEFKICQFTDLHLYTGDPKSLAALDTMRAVLAIEQPDLIVFSGDVVVSGEADAGWKVFIEAMTQIQIPYLLVPGNHDGEITPRRSILERLVGQPYFVGEMGPSDIKGYGNVALPIYDHAIGSKVKAIIWGIDSGDYPAVRKDLSYYDYIGLDQIDWYRKTSAEFTKKNGGKPIPSMMFMHIPLVELSVMPKDQFWYGIHGEPNCPSQINSGMFAAIIESGDVMGVFAGHDHDNDYVGLYKTIALGFGRSSHSCHTYGDLPAGGRTFILHEGERCFETWVSTPEGPQDTWYYPSGANTQYLREHPSLPALDVAPTQKGINYNYYEGNFETTDQIYKAQPVADGIAEDFDLGVAQREDWFGIDFSGYFQMSNDGIVKFLLSSDDGAVLFIDGVEVLNNDGSHSASAVEGYIALDKGFHKLQLRYVEHYASQSLLITVSGSGFSDSKLADFMYCK